MSFFDKILTVCDHHSTTPCCEDRGISAMWLGRWSSRLRQMICTPAFEEHRNVVSRAEWAGSVTRACGTCL